MDHVDVSGLLCIGTRETDGGEESYAAEDPKMDQDTSNAATKFDVVMETSAMYTDCINTDACLDEYHLSENQPMEDMRFGSAHSFELPSEGMVSDSEEESMPSDPDDSSSNYDVPGYMEHNLQHIYNSYDALVDKGQVMLSPAFVMCDKTLYLEPHLTFSLDGIKIDCLDLDSFDEKLVALQWEISNIISISCKWAQSVGSALITLLVGSEAETGNAGPVRVQFSLDDLQWPRRQQKIWQLGPRYQEIWKDIPSDDFENWSIEPCLFFPRQYFSSTEDFEDVIYPQGEPDAVSISKRDVELLLPETFVNDTIIDFYIKYLSTRIESTVKRRYHFFNSFFFRKLADLDKEQGRAPEGRAAFLRVRKWTRKINVFDKDFLFIPVNFNLHWSLIVICYPGEVAAFEGDAKVSAKLPCILHMDSLKGSHNGIKDIIQSYLWEEWKERHPESASDNSDKFLNLRFVSLELPQQDNTYDCGLFLLHYVELFLTDAPSNFNPLKIDVFSGFLSNDWFPPPEASLKRSVVRKLIQELVTGSFQSHPKLACGGEQLDERHQICSNAEPEPTGEFGAQRCSASEPETVCTVDDGTHEIQPSKSICLNDSEEKGLTASGCMLETAGVPIADVQNLQKSEVCAPDHDNVVCLSSQDEKNEPLESHAQRRSASEPETVSTVYDGTHEILPSKSICLNDSEEKGLPTSECMLDTGSVPIVDVQNLQESEVCSPVKEPESVCTVDDGHEIQPSKSICLNVSEEKGLTTSGCMLDTGSVPIVDVQNLQESEVCAPVKESKTVCTVDDGTHEIQPSKSICLNDSKEKGLTTSGCVLDTRSVPIVDAQNLQEPKVCAPVKESKTVGTVDDGTDEIQESKSICLNDSEEKGLTTSGCVLDTRSVPIVDAQNLQESEVCAPVKDTVVCLSSQDEKNEPFASNSQLKRSYFPEDDEVLKESNRVVTDNSITGGSTVSPDEREGSPGDAKPERHYKRRKVLALEKQSSFSGATSTDY